MPPVIVADLPALAEILNRSRNRRSVVVSSGFYNVFHAGHASYLLAAGQLGDLHVAVVNGDSALVRKRQGGRPFMSERERAAIVDAIQGVDFVLIWQGDTVDEVLERLQPDAYGKGGDRDSPESIPEWRTCERLGVQVVTGCGGPKVQSSSALLARMDGPR
jgi:cytidyltransferase-like protein